MIAGAIDVFFYQTGWMQFDKEHNWNVDNDCFVCTYDDNLKSKCKSIKLL
jgi:hypothetical protein